MNTQAHNFASGHRDGLDRYLPLLLAFAAAWMCMRGLKKLFWVGFGLFWTFHWMW